MFKQLKPLVWLCGLLALPALAAPEKDAALAAIADPSSTPEMIRFREDVLVDSRTVFQAHPQAFGLGRDDSMSLLSTTLDDLGMTHDHYQHLHKGVPVEGSEYRVHARSGQAATATGTFVPDLDLEVTPSIDLNQARAVALASVRAETYAWQAVDENGNPRGEYPSGELVITLRSDNLPLVAENFTLAFKFDVYALKPFSRDFVYVDARNGRILKKATRLRDYDCNCCGGTCVTLYNGTQSIDTRHRGFPLFNYLLRDNCWNVQAYLNVNSLTDTDNAWSAVNERPATTAFWAAERTRDYYQYVHGRNSYDNNGAWTYLYTNDNSLGADNAFWNGSTLHFGTGGGTLSYGPWVSLDTVGHEFTHGVTQYAANLQYLNEPGALNESYSDIFGTMIEFGVEGGGGNYLLGEDYWIQDGYIRSMQNPNAKTQTWSDSNCPGGVYNLAQPDTYRGTYWIDYNLFPNCDGGGIHINSGVQNYWFYLLAEGGSGVNDHGDAFSVQAIHMSNVRNIAYRRLTLYDGTNTGYVSARSYSIQAALDMFGACSNPVIQTANAWHAVGVARYSPSWDRHVCGPLGGTQDRAATHQLSAGVDAPTGCSSTTVQSGADVTFRAVTQIELRPGFSVPAGAKFTATIDPCAVTAF